MNKYKKIAVLFAAYGVTAISFVCADEHRNSIVEGKIVKLVPSKKEIYVRNDQGKYEFYFIPETLVVEGASARTYSDLYEGQKVKVVSRVIGKRLDPLSVEILPK